MTSAIELLATSHGGQFVAAGLSERFVEIWNLESGQRTAELNTILDFGGKRLAISGNEATCVTGAWTTGIAAYDIETRTLLWHRKDIKHIQQVSVSADSSSIYCGLEEQKLLVLDITSGRTRGTLLGVRRVVDTPFSNALLLVTTRDCPSHLVRGSVEFEIERLSFSVLDAVFGSNFLCISEVRGPVRCFDLQTGKEFWRFNPKPGTNVGKLGYHAETSRFFGTLANYEEGGPRMLLQFMNGTPRTVVSIGEVWASQFCLSGAALVTSSGQVFNTADGSVMRTLNFPERQPSSAAN